MLQALANKRTGYAEFAGEIRYGSMSAKEAQRYPGQIVLNTEDDISFPTLTVGQTIDFATRSKSPRIIPSSYSSRAHYQEANRDFLLQSMHIEHTRDTKVGNAYIRGVSGGERQRSSVAETLATRASLYCWDNPTRGLDASTALEYAKVGEKRTEDAQLVFAPGLDEQAIDVTPGHPCNVRYLGTYPYCHALPGWQSHIRIVRQSACT